MEDLNSTREMEEHLLNKAKRPLSEEEVEKLIEELRKSWKIEFEREHNQILRNSCLQLSELLHPRAYMLFRDSLQQLDSIPLTMVVGIIRAHNRCIRDDINV